MKTNSWSKLLNWRNNLEYYYKASKNVIVLKFLKKCPSCYSKDLQFVEGNKRFEKWFCRDCVVMHYKFSCPHCDGKIWYCGKYKTHIYKEYRLGKYKLDKNFYRKNSEEYIKQNIQFHQESVKSWKQKLEDFNKLKKYKTRYS